jgi:hypothetical protein
MIPALAELAEDLHPGLRCRNAVVKTLSKSIGGASSRLVPVFRRSRKRKEVIKGLVALFGLPASSPCNLTDRRDLAGPPLGYPGGNEGLRHGEYQEQRVEDLVVADMHTELLGIADRFGFTFKRRYVPVGYKCDLTGLEPIYADILRDAFYDTLLGVYEVGRTLGGVPSPDYVFHLTMTLLPRFSGQSWETYLAWLNLSERRREDPVEEFIFWMVSHLDDKRVMLGVVALLGLADCDHSPTIQERIRRAAEFLSHDLFDPSIDLARSRIPIFIEMSTRTALTLVNSGIGPRTLDL